MQLSDRSTRWPKCLCLLLAVVVSCGASLVLAVPPASAQTMAWSLAASGNGASVKKHVITFGTQTASATKPDSRGVYLFGSTPGGHIEDHVAVINFSDRTATFLIRGTDAVNTPQGGFAGLPINDRSHDLGTWIYLPRADLTVTLRARSDIIIPFLIKVPTNATPGDHVGLITATLVSSVISKSHQHLRLLQTTGSRIFLRVSGALRPSLTVTGLAVHYLGTLDPIGTGKSKITYTGANTGNVALGGVQTVYVSGLFGTRSTAHRLPKLQLLLPGYSVKESAEVTGIFPEIHETAHVSVRPLYIAGSAAPPSGPFQASLSFWAVPWILLAIIVAAILLAIGWIRRRRRRRRDGQGAAGPQQPGGADDAEKQTARSGVAASNGRPGRQAGGGARPATDPTPVASDD